MKDQPCILLVDDEEWNLRLMEAMLAPMAYRVFCARDGREALESVSSVDPDVILLDVMMPRMNGFEVVERLKADESTQIIPVVMVTALGEVEDRVRAFDAGADDFLTKPVDKLELRARVRSLVKVKAYHDHVRSHQAELETELGRRGELLRKSFEKIKNVSLETIHRLSQAAEYKDIETGNHIQRMSLYAAAVARQMDMSEAAVEVLLYAAPMHDVGKIGIPDHILLKPGPLNEDEWRIMKDHTVIGARILSGSRIGSIKLAEVIALTHHERWDGSGYPRGLQGDDIPIGGRITAVADVFDALTSRRPYKEPFSFEKSVEIIDNGRGSHFDPAVVDAFLKAKDEIRAIGSSYPDGNESHFVRMPGLGHPDPGPDRLG